MDAALYLCLRDELQQDAARVERQLEELRKAESFLLKRIQPSRNLASYRAVLQDLSLDISRAESDQAEFLRLSRFVTRALVTAYGKEPDSSRLAKPPSDPIEQTKPAREKPKAESLATSTQPIKPKADPAGTSKTKEPARSNGPLEPVQAASSPVSEPITKPVSKGAAPLTPPKTGVVEFDKDGFPIVAAPAKSTPAAKTPSVIAFQDTPPIAEPPTVVFDENGFPLNPPKNDSLNTLVEVRNPQTAANPLSKNDKS